MTSTPRSEREALREVLRDGLLELRRSPDPERAADDILRSLDAYLDRQVDPAIPPKSPLSEYEARQGREAKTLTWIIVAATIVATGLVAVAMGGGWPAAIVVLAIWAGGILALTST
jgi:anti-sigma factor RsiW